MKKNDSSLSFILTVEDVYNNGPQFTVVTGRVQEGLLKLGDRLTAVLPDNKLISLTCEGIERGRQLWDKAVAGDVIGILLKDPEAQRISIGTHLVKGTFSNIREHSLERPSGTTRPQSSLSFVLEIDDVYSSPALGTVVTGTVQTGVLHVRDRVTAVLSDNSIQPLVCEGIERGQQLWDKAVVGDTVGILFKDAKAKQLKKGDFLVMGELEPASESVSNESCQDHENSPSHRSKRLALLIGNISYPESPLKNCVNDARSFSELLQRHDFDVIDVFDADKAYMDEGIRVFCKEASKYEAALLFYSGHGMQHEGKTYLVPIDFPSASTLQESCCCVDDVINYLDIANCPTKIVILDSCRSTVRNINLGFSKGLVNIKSPEVFVAFSTAPGQVANDGFGQHSPFMQAILETMKGPSVPIYDFFKKVTKKVSELTGGSQIPWVNDCLTKTDFYLVR